MNLGQMMLIVLSLILVSTIVLTLHNNFQRQVEMATRNVYFTQGVKISDRIFQWYESQLISDKLGFDQMLENLQGTGITLTLETLFGVNYVASVSSSPSDLEGTFVPHDPDISPDHQRVTVAIVATTTGGGTFHIGTGEFPFSKVFSR